MKSERARLSQLCGARARAGEAGGSKAGLGERARFRTHGRRSVAVSLFIFLVDADVHSHRNRHFSYCFGIFLKFVRGRIAHLESRDMVRNPKSADPLGVLEENSDFISVFRWVVFLILQVSPHVPFVNYPTSTILVHIGFPEL